MGHGGRPPHQRKKKVAEALAEIERTGATTHPLIASIYRAQRYNTFLGGPFFTPLDVDDLPAEFTDTLDALTITLPNQRKASAEYDAYVQKWRASAARRQ